MTDSGETTSYEKKHKVDLSLIKRFNDAVLEVKGASVHDELLSQSQTIEIQLDEDPDYYANQSTPVLHELDAEILDFYDAPPSAAEVRPRAAKGVCIRHLSEFVLRQFETFLGPPSMGTMYNWEYLAAKMGLTASEIVYLRTQRNPTLEVLERFSSRPLDELLDITCDLGRIDLLLSVREHINESNPAVPSRSQATDSGQAKNFKEFVVGVAGSFITSSSLDTVNFNAGDRSISLSLTIPNRQKFILVVHHEKKNSTDLKKNFSWLMKNLRKYAGQEGFELFDIECCFDDTNLIGTINAVFRDALHIIFVFSEDFLELLQSETDRSLKRYIYDLSNGEYAQTLCNRRFRPVVFEGKDPRVLPIGWPTNTIVYEFPTMFSKLCVRIFK
ncbi:unnamed protein product [Enterobius vermicularis]|uniref:TIR domain-containing protein n=1 Tax=Enterobius vermicularis TaxID=51028 RepID=A0A0N4V195_ENTVE|nr:unnamed protein product [Enterobius vermicularis]